jgi:hypothetical protein
VARIKRHDAENPPAVANDIACPECTSPLPERYKDKGAFPPGKAYGLCEMCAAVFFFDAKTGQPRLCRTQEWVDLRWLPQHFDLLERREQVVEHLTRPVVEGGP